MKTLKEALILVGILPLLLSSHSCNPEEDDLVHESTLDQWTYFTTTNGLPSDSIISLYEDKKGGIWIGTEAGLSMYNFSA